MKEIKAYIKPNRINRVIEALLANGFRTMTLSQSEGTGAFKGRGARPSVEFHVTDSPVIKLELLCQNNEAQFAIEIIQQNAKTQEPGDGIICLSEVEDVFQIKTGESIDQTS